MKKESYEYREWKKYQNQKNLIRRSKKKAAIKRARSNQIRHDYELKKQQSYNNTTKKHEFHAPLDFSLINNPEETSMFFSNLISFIKDKRNFGKSLFIDISSISSLTIDALMYLLAIINNLNANFRNKFSFSGNEPSNATVKKMFSESGFYHFVRYQGAEPLQKNEDNVQIASGEDCDTSLAKRISDFVSEKANVNKRSCSFLYSMIIELMSNTYKHAYTENSILYPRWYCYAEYDGSNMISFSFMDIGMGIPATVQKNFAEKIDFLGLKADNKYIISALNGDFRTATQKEYRGKGLPKIKEFCSANQICNLHILANKADVQVFQEHYQARDIDSTLSGTLFYWQIDLSTLKGGIAC